MTWLYIYCPAHTHLNIIFNLIKKKDIKYVWCIKIHLNTLNNSNIYILCYIYTLSWEFEFNSTFIKYLNTMKNYIIKIDDNELKYKFIIICDFFRKNVICICDFFTKTVTCGT